MEAGVYTVSSGTGGQARFALARIIHDPGNCVTHCRSHVRQNVVVTLGHVPRSGERSYKPMNNPGLGASRIRRPDAGGTVDLAEALLPRRLTHRQDRRCCRATRGIPNTHPIGTPPDFPQSSRGSATRTILRKRFAKWTANSGEFSGPPALRGNGRDVPEGNASCRSATPTIFRTSRLVCQRLLRKIDGATRRLMWQRLLRKIDGATRD